jgi:hypothetical protein
MRAHGRKYDIGKRFAILIGVAAAGVMALGAQTGAAEEVVRYDSKVTIAHERTAFYWGSVDSEVSECERRRRVILFRPQPGADRKLRTTRTLSGEFGGDWRLSRVPEGRVYAKVTRKVGDGFVCRADRSKTLNA